MTTRMASSRCPRCSRRVQNRDPGHICQGPIFKSVKVLVIYKEAPATLPGPFDHSKQCYRNDTLTVLEHVVLPF